MVLNDKCFEMYCEKCGEKYANDSKWCKPCQIKDLKENWTSGNEKIDNFIQEMQLKIVDSNDTIVEWIPYNQLKNIKEISKSDSATLFSAVWTDGPLDYDLYNKKVIRKPDLKVSLKCLYNSQNNINEFLNEVWNF